MTIQECYKKMDADYEDVLKRLYSEGMIRKFARMFLDDDSYPKLERSLKEENVEEAFRAAHTLKGVCQNLGFTNLYQPTYELTEVLRPAMDFALSHGMEVNFTSPGWLSEDTLRGLGFTQIPSCGACLSNMAVAPDGTVLPCQSWLTGKGLGNMLRTPWPRIWHSGACRAIRGESAKMERRCQLGATPMQEGC